MLLTLDEYGLELEVVRVMNYGIKGFAYTGDCNQQRYEKVLDARLRSCFFTLTFDLKSAARFIIREWIAKQKKRPSLQRPKLKPTATRPKLQTRPKLNSRPRLQTK